jgi:hypothetical protein
MYKRLWVESSSRWEDVVRIRRKKHSRSERRKRIEGKKRGDKVGNVEA